MSDANQKISRAILPIPDPTYVGLTTYDAKDPDTKFPPITPLRPPQGAPNVLIVLLDDAGFAASSAFGGPCKAPTAERLAANGLKFTRFHTTALCSPTRQAMLTGRNHHSVNMGAVCEIATGAPGYTSVLPKNKAPLAMTMKLNGYSTAQFGKCHEVPVWQTSPMGPFDQWPTGGGGFEYFYGFIGGETNQWYPALFEGTTPIEPEKTPEEGYHLTEDMTNKAIKWVRQQKALMPDKPFFMYFAPGATHAPHHVPKEWADKYKGKFDGGWDKLRDEIFARQKKLGVIPADAQLTPRPAELPAWDATPDVMKPILTRQMEVYAGFLEHVDHHIGRLVDTLVDLEVLDDTLVYYIVGDNGASAEGTLNGSFNEMAFMNGMAALETPEFLMKKIDEFGGPTAYNHFAVGWAHAMDTPYQWTKQVASHWGGTRNGTIVHWPKNITSKGDLRHQFSHVIDIAATVLEAAGLPEPTVVNSIQQAPLEGVSMLYAFNDAKAARSARNAVLRDVLQSRHLPQGLDRRDPAQHALGARTSCPRLSTTSGSCMARMTGPRRRILPRRIRRSSRSCKLLFLIEAAKHQVLPLDDRRVERFNPELAGRPQLIRGKTQILFGGMGRLTENSVVQLKNKSHSVTADVVVPTTGAQGVIIAQGGATGGWSLYAKDGRLKYLLQPARGQVLVRGGHHTHPGGQAPGPHGVRLRRRRACQGRHRVAVRGRDEGRRVPRGHDCPDGLLVRRDVRHRHGRRVARLSRLRPARQPVQRRGQLGADRPRERRSRSPDYARRAVPRGHGAPVSATCGRARAQLRGRAV